MPRRDPFTELGFRPLPSSSSSRTADPFEDLGFTEAPPSLAEAEASGTGTAPASIQARDTLVDEAPRVRSERSPGVGAFVPVQNRAARTDDIRLSSVDTRPKASPMRSPSALSAPPLPTFAERASIPAPGEPTDETPYQNTTRAQDVGTIASAGLALLGSSAVGLADIGSAGLGYVTKTKVPQLGEQLRAMGLHPDQFGDDIKTEYSPATQAAGRKFDEAASVMEKAGVLATHPSLVLKAIGESIPSIVGGGMIGKAVAGGTAVAAGLGEGAMSGGSLASQMGASSDDGRLSAQQAALAAGAGAIVGAIGTYSNRLAERLGVVDADRVLIGAATNPAQRVSFAQGVKQVLAGARQEGLEEVAQSDVEQMVTNIGTGRPVLEGVAEASLMGFATGVAMGGGLNTAATVAGNIAARPSSAEIAAEEADRADRRARFEAANAAYRAQFTPEGQAAREAEQRAANLAASPQPRSQAEVSAFFDQMRRDRGVVDGQPTPAVEAQPPNQEQIPREDVPGMVPIGQATDQPIGQTPEVSDSAAPVVTEESAPIPVEPTSEAFDELGFVPAEADAQPAADMSTPSTPAENVSMESEKIATYASLSDVELMAHARLVPAGQRGVSPVWDELERRGGAIAVANRAKQEPTVTEPKTLQSGRKNKALDGIIRVNGDEITRRELVDARVSEGAVVKAASGSDFNTGRKATGRDLVMPDGSFLNEQQIGKVALDYAEQLIARQNAPDDPPVRTLAAIDDDLVAHRMEKPKSYLQTFGKGASPDKKGIYNARVKAWREKHAALQAEWREARDREEGQAQADYIAQYPDRAADMAEPAEDLPRAWRERVRMARAAGFTGSVEQLAGAYRDIRSRAEVMRDADAEDGDEGLFRAIAAAGGIKWDGSGEIQALWEASPDYKQQGRRKDGKGVKAGKRMPRGRLYGVAGVLRNDGTGLSLDALREALSPENGGNPAWTSDTADLNAFLDRIQNAAHNHAIGNVGEDLIDWTRPWWREVVNDAGRSPIEQDILDVLAKYDDPAARAEFYEELRAIPEDDLSVVNLAVLRQWEQEYADEDVAQADNADEFAFGANDGRGTDGADRGADAGVAAPRGETPAAGDARPGDTADDRASTRTGDPGRAGRETESALPGLERVRSQALGAVDSKIARVSAQAPGDGFTLSAERADGRTLSAREQLEDSGQASMFGDEAQAEPEPQSFTAQVLEKVFGYGRNVAEATFAIAEAMGLDIDRIALTKGGTPGAGAMGQAARRAKKPTIDTVIAAIGRDRAASLMAALDMELTPSGQVLASPRWEDSQRSNGPGEMKPVSVTRVLTAIREAKPSDYTAGVDEDGIDIRATIREAQQAIAAPVDTLYQQSRPSPFYSRLIRAVESSSLSKASGAQWKATIRNAKTGINADEFALVGVADLFDPTTYTKQDVLDYLSANQVVVKDVTLGDNPSGGDETEYAEAVSALREAANLAMQAMGTFPARRDILEAAYRGDAEAMPTIGRLFPSALPHAQEAVEANRRLARLTPPREPRQGDTQFGRYQEPGADPDSYREVFLTAPSAKASWNDGHAAYRPIANPIVRLRFNTRTTEDGSRVLFLEEVQPPSPTNQKAMPSLFTKHWRDIAFKWAIRHASEQGLDGVAWTPGAVQAKRYDLSKQIDALEVKKSGGGEYYTVVGRKNGVEIVAKNGVRDHELADVIGKELAEKAHQQADGRHVYTGVDLKVGGEGLIRLYDVDFRNVANAIPAVKKAGAKVGTAALPNVGNSPYLPLTDAIRDAVMAGQPLFQPAYHGSPHVFDNFSLHAIGSGEGSQAFGWGLYFTDTRSVADFYRRKTSDEQPRKVEGGGELTAWMANRLTSDPSSIDALIADFEGRVRDAESEIAEQRGQWWNAQTYLPALRDHVDTLKRIKAGANILKAGRTYKVEIPEDEDYLLWDKPISKQSEKVRSALARLGFADTYDKSNARVKDIERELKAIMESPEYARDNPALDARVRALKDETTRLFQGMNQSGELIYRRLQQKIAGEYPGATKGYAAPDGFNSHRIASERLSGEGIAGIKYLDQASRGQGDGTYNYVIFDDKLVQIMEYDQGARASVEFSASGKALIRALQDPNASTGIHELAHIARRWLLNRDVPSEQRRGISDEDIRLAETWAGAKDGAWSVAAEEKFARGFERYLRDGVSPTPRLSKVFGQFKAWLSEIYQTLTGSEIDIEISPEMRQVFDRLITRSARNSEETADRVPRRYTYAKGARPGRTWIVKDPDGNTVRVVDSNMVASAIAADLNKRGKEPLSGQASKAQTVSRKAKGVLTEAGRNERRRIASEPPAAAQDVSAPTLSTRDAFLHRVHDAQPPSVPVSEAGTIAVLRDIFGQPESGPPSILSRFRKDAPKRVPLPVGYKRFNQRALGLYKVKPHIIRLKAFGDLSTFVHELGHALDMRLLGQDAPDGLMDAGIIALGNETTPPNQQDDMGLLRAEGVANFFRAYFRDPAWARSLAPGYAAQLEAHLGLNPGIRAQMEAGVSAVRGYLAQDDATRGAAMIDFTGKRADSPRTRKQRTYDALFDEFDVLKRIERKLTSAPLAYRQSAYWLRRVANGVDGKVTAFLEDHVRNSAGQILGPGLRAILKPLTTLEQQQKFSQYLIARHALHHYAQQLQAADDPEGEALMARYGLPVTALPKGFVFRFKDPGMTRRQAEALLTRERTAQFDELSEKLAAYRTSIFTYLLDRGAIGRDVVDLLETLYVAYVPLARVMGGEGGGYNGGGSKNEIASLASPVKARRGSTRDIIDPIETMIANTQALVRFAEHNNAWRALTTLAQKTPDGGAVMDRIPTPMVPRQVNLQQIKGSIAKLLADTFDFDLGAEIKDVIAERKDEAEAEIADREPEPAEAKKILADATKNPLDMLATYFAPVALGQQGHDIERVIVDGEPQWFEIQDRELLEWLHGLDAQAASRMVDLVDAVAVPLARIKRSGVTLAIDFSARNVVRDALMAFVQSNYGFTPGVDTLKGLKSFLSQDANYWLWRSGGGEMATFAGQDREEVRAYIQNVLKLDHVTTPTQLVRAFVDAFKVSAETFKKSPTAADKATTAARSADMALLQPLRAFSSALEAATRLGEFRLALDKEGYHRTGDPGKQEEALMKAVIASRDVSIDFQRGGWWSRRHTQRSVFFNPALQGSLRLAETAKAHPIRTARRVAITSLAPALLSVVLRGLFDRDEEWAELDPGVRATYWHFPAPWGWLRVPKAYDIDDLVGTPMEATLAAIAQQDPAILKELVPGGYDGAVRWLLQRVVPSAFVPMIEYAANYKFFTDRPIVPDSRRKVDLELQASRYTSEFARRVAPKIGMAPDALDHLFYGYVGGMGRLSTTFVADPLIAAMDAATGRTGPPKPSRGIEGVPVLGVFVRHGGAGLQAKSLADLYDELEKWDGKMQSRREYRQAGNASKVSDVDAWITTHGGEKRYRALQKAREGMSAERATLNKVFRAPASVLTADDKAILLDAIEARMGNAARVAMGRQPLGVVTATPDPLVASLEKKLADWKPEAGIKKTPWTP